MKKSTKAKKASSRKAARKVKILKVTRQAAAYPIYDEVNYEQALAKSVLDSHSAPESEDAVTLAAALGSLTISLKRISYNYGLQVGRSIYRLYEGRKSYKWYGDSIQDLVGFLEKLGYNYILYKILTDNVEISVYRKNRTGLGCNIHSFDAGIIAGFLGAARGEFVRVYEVSCCNNGSECCRFTTAPSLGDPFCVGVDKLEGLFNSERSSGWVRQEYQVLVTTPLMNAEYSSQINSILSHLGQKAMGGAKGRLSPKVMDKAAMIMERFGLARVEYTARPQKISLTLDGAKAKKEFVDISISFLNGMIGGYFSKPLKSQLSSSKKGAYKITMKQ